MKNGVFKIFNLIKQCSLLEITFLINAITIVHIKLVPYGISILFLVWLFELFRRKIFLDRKYLKGSLFIAIPFLLASLSLLYTSNLNKGIEELSRLLPFLLFPFFFLFRPKNQKNKNNTILFFIVFVTTLIIRLLINLYESFSDYLEVPRLYYFIYSWYVQDTNIVSIYILFALLGLFAFFSRNGFKKNKIVFWVIQLFLLCSLVLLQSRIVIASYFIGMVLILILNKKSWSLKYGLILLVFPVFIFLLPIAQSRFTSIKEQTLEVVSIEKQSNTKIEKQIDNGDDLTKELEAPASCKTSFQLRYNAYKSTLSIIKNNLFIGVGTGDWRDELTEDYRINNKICNYVEQTAPHNQYLRTTLKHGLIGGLILLIYLIVLFKTSKKSSSILALPFMISLILTSFGYDVLDVGGLAPINAFFLTVIFVPILFREK